jgi:hypothetical protein
VINACGGNGVPRIASGGGGRDIIIIIINMLMPAYQSLFYTSKSPIGAPGAAIFV